MTNQTDSAKKASITERVRAAGISVWYICIAITGAALVPLLLVGIIALELQTFNVTLPWWILTGTYLSTAVVEVLYLIATTNSYLERFEIRKKVEIPPIVQQWVPDSAVAYVSYMFPQRDPSDLAISGNKIWLITRRHKIMYVPVIFGAVAALMSILMALYLWVVNLDGKNHVIHIGSGANEQIFSFRVPSHFTQIMVTVFMLYVIIFMIRVALKYADWACEYYIIWNGELFRLIAPFDWLPWRDEEKDAIPSLTLINFISVRRSAWDRLIRSGKGRFETPAQLDEPFQNLNLLPNISKIVALVQQATEEEMQKKENDQSTNIATLASAVVAEMGHRRAAES